MAAVKYMEILQINNKKMKKKKMGTEDNKYKKS